MSTSTRQAMARDNHPKVISYPYILDGLDIVAKEDILWPCHAFSISIPNKKKNALNIFEETVLKIIQIEGGDTGHIAQITCLDNELVSFIQNRLRQLELINNHYELSEKGKELLEDWSNNSKENVEYSLATIFVDLFSGNILPFVDTEQLNYKKIREIRKNGFVNFLINPTDEKFINARQIRPTKSAVWNKFPDVGEVIKAIKGFKIKYKRYALLNNSLKQYPPLIPQAEAVLIQEEPKFVYIHCKALIQAGNSDLLITDGFGLGFSEVFSDYLNSQDWPWVTEFKSKGLIDYLDSENNNEKEGYKFLTVKDQLSKYPKISRPLERAKNKLLDAKSINSAASTNEEMKFSELTGQVIVSLYESIEWSLRFVVSEYPVESWEQIFKSQSYKENDRILGEFASKIGFDVSSKIKGILQIMPGKIRAMERGKADMQPLLALAIAGAINDSGHPFHSLAMEDSGTILFIKALKDIRDPISHGNSNEVSISVEVIEKYWKRAIRIIKILIPDITHEEHYPSTVPHKNLNQERLKAKIKLEENLGTKFIQSISKSLLDELLKVEILSLKKQLHDDDKKDYIFFLSSIVQLMFLSAIRNGRGLFKSQGNIRNHAIDNIIQAKFYENYEDVPESIKTVNIKRIEDSAKGNSTTLGAQLLGTFLVREPEKLQKLNQAEPDVIELVNKLNVFRGHNEVPSYYSKHTLENLNVLKNEVFRVLITLKDIF